MFGSKKFFKFGIGCLVVCSTLLQFSTSAQAGVFYQEGWEDGKIVKPSLGFEGNCYTEQKHGYNSMELSKKRVREGNYSNRLELHGDDKNSVCSRAYLVREAKSRNELRFLANDAKGQFKHGSEHWFTTSYYFPSNEGSFSSWWPKSQRVIIFQLLGAGNSQTPEIHFLLGNKGRLDIEMSASVTPSENLIKDHKAVTIKPDQWVDVVVHWKRSWQSDGILQIWINGNLVVNKKGPTAIRDKPYAVAKAGMYFGTEIRPYDYIMYLDNFKIGDKNSSYDKMVSGIKADVSPMPPVNLNASIY